jgi:hypothetical protein
VSKRFWIATAVGAALGAGAVAGFGPWARAAIAEKAERHGLEVQIEHVVPTLGGVRLRGVTVVSGEIPGVRVWVDEVLVGWSDRRPREVAGGRIALVGEPDVLLGGVERWRARRGPGGGGASGVGSWPTLGGFEVEWRERPTEGAPRLRASGVGLARGGDGGIVLSAERVVAELAQAVVAVERGRVALERGEGGLRVKEVGGATLVVDVRTSRTAEVEPAPDKEGAGPGATGRADAGAGPAGRRLYARALALGAAIDHALADGGRVEIGAASAKLRIDDDVLGLGPGALRIAREGSAVVVALSPEARAPAERKALTFTLRIPRGTADASAPAMARAAGAAAAGDGPANGGKPAAVVAELRGGPVWLSTLGLRDGDLGLRNVASASLESDARVMLLGDGESLSVDGNGRLRKLSLASPKLAEAPLEDVELAWRARLDARLDGTLVRVHDAEVDLGELRFMVRGVFERQRGAGPQGRDRWRVDASYQVPLVGCQRAFDSLPRALVPTLGGVRFSGSLGAEGRARFDTARLARDYDVGWDGILSCRITEVPPEIDPRRFRAPFDKTVWGPHGEIARATFGPTTDAWVPYGSISRFVEGAVLTTEDGRFHRHHGFDQEAIVNSLRENLQAGAFVRGASTISMQLAKNLYLSRTKTVSRKLEEAVLTLLLEQELTKPEMMELYLNVIEFGPNVYGIGPAAQHYFHTSASRLSLGQALYLGSILRNPRKQFFGPGGAVSPAHMAYLKKLMRIVRKIGQITDEDLELGLRETVVFGSPEPVLAPPEPAPFPEPPADGAASE